MFIPYVGIPKTLKVKKMLLNYLEPSYQIGSFTIHLYGALLAIGIIIGLFVARKLASERNIKSDYLYELAIICIFAGIIGARLLSLALHPQNLLQDPWSIFSLHEGGLAAFGGLAGGIAAGLLYARWRQISFWTIADVVAPSLALGEAITRLGCDVYGYASPAAPFPRIVNGIPHHNIPLYTFLATATIFIILWKMRANLVGGRLFLTYLLLYGGSRLFIDYFRGEHLFLSLINLAQGGSLLIALLALLFLTLFSKKPVTK